MRVVPKFRAAAVLALVLTVLIPLCIVLIVDSFATKGIAGALEFVGGVILGLIAWGIYAIRKNLPGIEAWRKMRAEKRFLRQQHDDHAKPCHLDT